MCLHFIDLSGAMGTNCKVVGITGGLRGFSSRRPCRSWRPERIDHAATTARYIFPPGSNHNYLFSSQDDGPLVGSFSVHDFSHRVRSDEQHGDISRICSVTALKSFSYLDLSTIRSQGGTHFASKYSYFSLVDEKKAPRIQKSTVVCSPALPRQVFNPSVRASEIDLSLSRALERAQGKNGVFPLTKALFAEAGQLGGVAGSFGFVFDNFSEAELVREFFSGEGLVSSSL